MCLEIQQQLKGSATSSLSSSFSGGNISVAAQSAAAHSALKSLTKEVIALRMETGHLDTEEKKENNKREMKKEGGKI